MSIAISIALLLAGALQDIVGFMCRMQPSSVTADDLSEIWRAQIGQHATVVQCVGFAFFFPPPLPAAARGDARTRRVVGVLCSISCVHNTRRPCRVNANSACSLLPNDPLRVQECARDADADSVVSAGQPAVPPAGLLQAGVAGRARRHARDGVAPRGGHEIRLAGRWERAWEQEGRQTRVTCQLGVCVCVCVCGIWG